MVNWCDDAIEPNEPERVIHSEWEITSGTLRFKVPSSGLNEGINSSSPVTAEIEGLEVAGQRIPLPATITNDAYGFFPG